MRLKDKVIVLTGAAGAGIGQTSARKFAAEGAKIVVSDTHEKRTVAAAEAIERDFGVEAIGLLCDVRENDQVEALMRKAVERFGRIDGLLNNAGQTPTGQVLSRIDRKNG